MIRRQLISDELRYSHQTSPRKTRTYVGSSLYQPTLLYVSKLDQNTLPKPESWVGKELIPWNGEFIQPYLRSIQLGINNPKIISEFEIANYCKSNYYRIFYVYYQNGEMYVKSKPSIDYVPSRMNIFLTTDNVIRKIMYF